MTVSVLTVALLAVIVSSCHGWNYDQQNQAPALTQEGRHRDLLRVVYGWTTHYNNQGPDTDQQINYSGHQDKNDEYDCFHTWGQNGGKQTERNLLVSYNRITQACLGYKIKALPGFVRDANAVLVARTNKEMYPVLHVVHDKEGLLIAGANGKAEVEFVGNVETCKALCVFHPGCNFATFHGKTLQCSLFKKNKWTVADQTTQEDDHTNFSFSSL